MNNCTYLLVGINAKYIHTSLAVRTLYAYVKSPRLSWREYNINEDVAAVCADIYAQMADTILFSCYIWNIEFIIRTARRLKQVAPETEIIFGGPEVSYAAQEYMEKYSFIDAVICGEGEETLKRIIETGTLNHFGVTYRDKTGRIISCPHRPPINDISVIPFPYTDEDIEQNKNKLIYYESSRGCPFGCTYCLSSADRSLRFRDLSLIFNELDFFIRHSVKIVKFTDRTFNADKKRAEAIIKFLIARAPKTTFHFEAAADLLDRETLSLLKTAPPGLFQLEIGVQSTNKKTLASINRKTNIAKIADTVRTIRSFGNIHLHLDLIAGLPYEDYESFRRSFNDVFAMEPHVIQLGFLKLLHGTKIREAPAIYTYEPPYEVLKTPYISYEELLKLKRIEDIVEKYYNSGAFSRSVKQLCGSFPSPFDFFEALSFFYSKGGFDKIGIPRDRLYEILLVFAQTVPEISVPQFTELLLFDYLENNKPRTPKWAKREPVLKQRFNILTEDFINEKLTEYCGMSAKEIIKHVHFERFFFPERIVIFDREHHRIIDTKKESDT